MKLTRNAHRVLSVGSASLGLSLILPLTALAAPPAPAAQAGYNVNTFSSNFTGATVDMNQTLNRGYKWYIADLFSKQASPTGVKINTDGSVSLLGDSTNSGAGLMSAVQYRGTNSWVGTAFGGGLYIEWVANYNPAQVESTHAGGRQYPYPGFWGLSMEGNMVPGGTWPGQASNYMHNVEVDFFEAAYATKPSAYGSGMHDWYGIRGVTCANLCVVSFQNPSGERDPPTGTNFTQWHTYGVLWVPATATTKGSFDAYFDGQRIGYTHSWSQYTTQGPTPVNQPWAFGKVDQQHIFLIVGTGQGETFNIKSVNVWQKSGSSNMVN